MSKNLHCCESLRNAAEDPDIAVEHIRKFREYGIRILDGGSSHLRIFYCPWCGKKLPDNLRNHWFDELERLGIDAEDDVIPEEFTDERWYEARNL